MMKIFGKGPTPEEQVKSWRSKLRAEQREIDRSIRGITTEEEKIKRSIKEAAKRGDKTTCKTLAKEIIRSKKAKDRLYGTKAQLNSVVLQLQQQLSNAKIAGVLKKSTDIMKVVNNLTKIPELQKTMMELSKEMMKAGLIEEMMDDALETLDDEDIEEAADEEVERVITEITSGIKSKSPSVPVELEAETPEDEQDEDDLEKMQQRLQALTN